MQADNFQGDRHGRDQASDTHQGGNGQGVRRHRNAGGLRGWWTADTKTDEKVGGKAEFGFDKRGMVFRMRIEKLDPDRRVVWSCHGDHQEWADTVLTWGASR